MGKVTKSILLISLVLGGVALIYFLNRNNTSEIEGLPPEITEFLTQEDLDNLEELDYPIHFGLNPPNIEGVYHANSQKVDYDKIGITKVNTAITNTHESFYDQTDDLQISKDTEHLGKDSRRIGQEAYISGEDNCFSVFTIGVTEGDFGCITTLADVITGCLDEEGNIEGFQKSLLMLNHNSRILCSIIPKALKMERPMGEGNIRIITERDGVAERVEEEI